MVHFFSTKGVLKLLNCQHKLKFLSFSSIFATLFALYVPTVSKHIDMAMTTYSDGRAAAASSKRGSAAPFCAVH